MKSSLHIAITTCFLLLACSKEEHRSDRKAPVQDHSQMVMLDAGQQELTHIELETASTSTISAQTTVVGRIAEDKNRSVTISARVNGRIDKLYVRQEGERVVNGQALYSIYSEDLLTNQNDYLSALEQRKKFAGQNSTVEAVIESARKKLSLWGMTEQQLKNLEVEKRPSSLLTYHSNYNGFLSELLIREGEYVQIGKLLFEIADLHSVWIEAQVYQNEIKYLSDETKATIRIDGLPLKEFEGKVVFENPTLEANSKINLVRFIINDADNSMRPGMMARVTIMHQKKEALIIPKSALLIGEMTLVWIETTPGMYQSQAVRTGIENKDFVEIIHGLQEGDKVVTSGAYLLNSDFILKKGAVKVHSH